MTVDNGWGEEKISVVDTAGKPKSIPDIRVAINSYNFQNRENLIAKLNQKKPTRVCLGILIGIIIAAFFAEVGSWWVIIPLVATPFLFSVSPEIKRINQSALLHENFLINTEKSVRGILAMFQRRYFEGGQMISHLPDLANLINKKMGLNLTEKDSLFLLNQYEKGSNLEIFDKEISTRHSSSENISIQELAKTLIKLCPTIDFDNEESFSSIFRQFCEYLTKKDIKYDLDELKRELISEYHSLRASHFEAKLTRDFDNKIIQQVETMDGFEFEKFLGELFQKAGYKVVVTKKTGDQGADIIVERNGISTAVQAKRYTGNVGNGAVQEVVAAMKYYDCDKSMVITTGDFTKSAYRLAASNGVRLIGKDGLDGLFDAIA